MSAVKQDKPKPPENVTLYMPFRGLRSSDRFWAFWCVMFSIFVPLALIVACNQGDAQLPTINIAVNRDAFVGVGAAVLYLAVTLYERVCDGEAR